MPSTNNNMMNQNLNDSATALSVWSKICCFASPAFGFVNCLFVPCIYQAGKADHQNVDEKKIRSIKRWVLFGASMALIVTVASGLTAGKTIASIVRHEQACAYNPEQRVSCVNCVDLVAANVTELHSKGKGPRGKRGDRKLQEFMAGDSTSVSEAELFPSTDADVERPNGKAHGKPHGKSHGKHHPTLYHWGHGTQQACVVGDGPLNFEKHGKHHHHTTNTTNTTTTTVLAPCHESFLKGEAPTGNATCPFFGHHGQDVIKQQLEEDPEEEVKLILHCNKDQDCPVICDCLGGELHETPIWLKLIVLTLTSLLSLGTFGLLLPKLYHHHKQLNIAARQALLDAAQENELADVGQDTPPAPEYRVAMPAQAIMLYPSSEAGSAVGVVPAVNPAYVKSAQA